MKANAQRYFSRGVDCNSTFNSLPPSLSVPNFRHCAWRAGGPTVWCADVGDRENGRGCGLSAMDI